MSADGARAAAGSGAFRPSGLVTLLTDFGRTDTYVGVMHGVLHRLAPGLHAVVDLTHGVPAQDVEAAAFHLSIAWRYFAAGTVHVAVVDPGVGSGRRILLALAEGQAFLAPDNGLLERVLPPGTEVRELDPAQVAEGPVSNTFHGRDLFCPAAAALAEGRPVDELAPVGVPFEPLAPRPRPAGRLEGRIVSVDHFGNLISDLPAEWIAPERGPWRVALAGVELELAPTYASVPTGALLALIDSAGRVEVAVRDGSAAERLGLGPGAALICIPATDRRS